MIIFVIGITVSVQHRDEVCMFINVINVNNVVNG